MPALVRGMTEQIQQADLTDMKFSTELEEQGYRKALAAQATALGNRILKASKTNTAVNIQNLTDTKNDTKGNTILNMALNTSIADATTTKLGITTTNEIKNATATNTQTKTNVQPSTKTVTPVQIITGTHNPPPDNNNKKSPPDISLNRIITRILRTLSMFLRARPRGNRALVTALWYLLIVSRTLSLL